MARFPFKMSAPVFNRLFLFSNLTLLAGNDPFQRSREQGVFSRIGEATFQYVSDLRDAVSFVGSVCLAMVQAISESTAHSIG